MKAQLKFFVHYHSGAPMTEIIIEAPVKIAGTQPSEHDLAAIMFAAEFAINNEASKTLGKPLRAHFFLAEES